MKRFLLRLKKSASLIYSVLNDKRIASREFETMIGPGFLKLHINKSSTDNKNYVLIEARGGETTVYVPVDFSTIEQIIEFTNGDRRGRSE